MKYKKNISKLPIRLQASESKYITITKSNSIIKHTGPVCPCYISITGDIYGK